MRTANRDSLLSPELAGTRGDFNSRVPAVSFRSERAQEQDQVLLVQARKLIVVFDGPVGLASRTCVLLDGLEQV